MKYSVEIYKDKKKEFRFRVVHRNGRIICNSGEGYKQKASIKKALFNLGAGLLSENYKLKDLTA